MIEIILLVAIAFVFGIAIGVYLNMVTDHEVVEVEVIKEVQVEVPVEKLVYVGKKKSDWTEAIAYIESLEKQVADHKANTESELRAFYDLAVEDMVSCFQGAMIIDQIGLISVNGKVIGYYSPNGIQPYQVPAPKAKATPIKAAPAPEMDMYESSNPDLY